MSPGPQAGDRAGDHQLLDLRAPMPALRGVRKRVPVATEQATTGDAHVVEHHSLARDALMPCLAYFCTIDSPFVPISTHSSVASSYIARERSDDTLSRPTAH